MRKNARVEFGALRHLRADGAVAVNAMHREIARAVVGVKHVRAGGIHAGVDRALRQHRRFAVQLQCAIRIHAYGGDAMHFAGIGRVAGCGIRAGDIEELPRWVRPHILNIGGEGDRAARRQGGGAGVHIKLREPVADTLIKHAATAVTTAAARAAGGATSQRSHCGTHQCGIKCASIHDGHFVKMLIKTYGYNITPISHPHPSPPSPSA